MKHSEIQERIAARRVLSAAMIEDVENAVPLARALLAGGLDVMEVTFRNDHAAECIRRIRAAVPEMMVGAGTLLTVGQLDEARAAGAVFGLSPGFNPNIVKAAVERDFFFISGVMTPGEMEQSLELGSPWVKLFPAGFAGVDFIRMMAGPYERTPLRMIPLGGVNEQNLDEFLALPVVVAVGGSWLSNRDLVAAGEWETISEITRRALAKAGGAGDASR